MNAPLQCKWLAVLALVTVASSALSATPCARYNTPGVKLEGVVTIRTFYGPPNFGENPATDDKVKQAILKLDRPLCVLASEDDNAEDKQREVTLVPSENIRFAPYAGKRVRVTGSLYHGFNAHHNTPVLIQVHGAPEVLR